MKKRYLAALTILLILAESSLAEAKVRRQIPGLDYDTTDLSSMTGVVPMANGGTAAALSDPNAHRLIGWDDTDGANKFWTLGSGLSYDAATDTITATGTGDITDVGNCTGSAAFSGSCGYTLTFDNAGGDGTLTYDGTNFTFDKPVVVIGSLGGGIDLAENSSVALDPAGSADGKFSGITVTGTAGYTQAFGDIVYLDPTDSRWEQCDANSAAAADGDSRGIVGMVVSSGTDGNACTILLRGIIRADAKFPSFTINNPIYISETAGSVTQTQPTTTDVVIRIVGAAMTADEMYFSPDNTWTTHT